MEHQARKELYDKYPFLKAIDLKNDDIIIKTVQFRVLEADDYISTINITCSSIVFVLDGKINIKRLSEDGEETNLYNLSSTEICHEALSCIFECKSLNIVARSLTKSKIALIPRTIFEKYIINNIDFLVYAYKDIFNKFSRLIENKEKKNNQSLEKRLIDYILNKNSEIIYVTHKEIADEIDCTREAVSRKLKNLEKGGYLKLSRGKITILNRIKSLDD